MMIERRIQCVTDNPNRPCPPELLAQQIGLQVLYYGFDGELQQGIIEVHKQAADDVDAFFAAARAMRFPIERVVRSSDPEFGWNDNRLMAANTTSGFNYRTIAGSDTVSMHGSGLAFDVNTRINPYIRYEGGRTIVEPAGAVWNSDVPGALSAGHPLVKLMKSRGWGWGGDWTPEYGMTDYQHFQTDKLKV